MDSATHLRALPGSTNVYNNFEIKTDDKMKEVIKTELEDFHHSIDNIEESVQILKYQQVSNKLNKKLYSYFE